MALSWREEEAEEAEEVVAAEEHEAYQLQRVMMLYVNSAS